MNNSTASPTIPTITAGRYAGRPVTTVPPDYLRWVVDSAADPLTRSIAEAELGRRANRGAEFEATAAVEDLDTCDALAAMLRRVRSHAERGDRERFIMGLSSLSGECALRFETLRKELGA